MNIGIKIIVAFGCAGLAVLPAAAQCPAIDFENLAVGTVVTTQYDGVTFSAQTQSCGGDPTVYMRIASAPVGGTSSGTKTLEIDPGCDFSPDYLRMVFDNLQSYVSFTLGEATGNDGYVFQVRYYNNAGALLGTKTYTSGAGIHTLVEIGSAGGTSNIRRIEVDSTIDAFEVIDDLQFDVDTTPPEALIDTPAYDACVCGTVMVRGKSCDADGGFDHDILEYKRTDADPNAAWTTVGTATTPQCTAGGALYTWNTAALAEGEYYLRMTTFNDCGLFTTAITIAYVSRSFNGVELRSPAERAVVGGTITVDGTVNERCFASYTVNYRPDGGAWQAVDPAHASYTTAVINDPLANWNTSALADGLYQLRVVGTESCGNTQTVTHNVTLDQSVVSFIADLDHDGDVDLADLALFAEQWLSGT